MFLHTMAIMYAKLKLHTHRYHPLLHFFKITSSFCTTNHLIEICLTVQKEINIVFIVHNHNHNVSSFLTF